MNPTFFNRKRLLLPFIVIVVVLIPVFLFVFKGKFQIPNKSLFIKSSVDLKTSYNNPFKKETQYVNPFNTYKNPFIVNR